MFLFGLWPRFWFGFGVVLLFALFPLAKRKSGWGICGSSLFVWLWFSLFWFNRSADFKDFVSLYRVLAAYSHVRTEPLARHRPHSRKKKVSPIGTGRLVAMVGTAEAPADDGGDLQILFGLVLAITSRTSKSKDELPASRIHRQCNPRFIEVAFLSRASH